jgi:hypothetical protein
MFRDPLVRKAWELCRQTAQCPLAVILEATVWLEEKYTRTPHSNTAIVIALQYLLLAMRHELRSRPTIAKEYFSRAVHWREEAIRLMSEHNTLAVQQGRN